MLCDSHTDIDGGQKSKDKGLHHGDKDLKAHDCGRNEYRADLEERRAQHFVGGDDEQESESQGTGSDDQVEPFERSHWLDKKELGVLATMHHQTRDEIGQYSDASESGSGIKVSRRSGYLKVLAMHMRPPVLMLEHWEGQDAQQVGAQDKGKHRTEQRQISLVSVFADGASSDVGNKGIEVFEDRLPGTAGSLDDQIAGDRGASYDDQDHRRPGHDHCIGMDIADSAKWSERDRIDAGVVD